MSKNIMICAGEASGDTHSASLIAALRKIHPDIKISGIGGERMKSVGCEIFTDIKELSIIGFTDVIKNIKRLERVFNNFLTRVDQEHPDAVILVDYPGFNLKLAQALKKKNVRIIYYISPQIWAWWKNRIKTIKKLVDKMIVIFEFEEKLYRQHNVDVTFVGHPLLDAAHPEFSREEFIHKLNLSDKTLTIGLAPGSRKMEVERILPILIKSARILKKSMPEVQFVILKAPELKEELFQSIIKKLRFPVAVCNDYTYDFLNICDFVLVASGTATLETAIMQKPMAIVYKVSFLNWLIARLLIHLPYIGLVNVVAGKQIVPEFIQFRARPSLIAKETEKLLKNHANLTIVKQELKRVYESLGTHGATHRAATVISSYLS